MTYTATLNTSASLASTGKDNTNSAKGVLLQRPDRGRPLCVRRDLHVSVHVQLDLKKTDGTNPLAGATFQLKDAQGNVINLVATGSSNTYRPAMADEASNAVTEVTTPTDGTIHFIDLAEGSYMLTETKAPEGLTRQPTRP